MTRIFATTPVEVTRIGERLNEISETVAVNPKIEAITGSDFIVYLTYSYDSEDILGWIFSATHDVYKGTPKMAGVSGTWFEKEKDAKAARLAYEETVLEYLLPGGE